ncbi:MAG TPA: endopeptidase La [Spirochaetia bacterium]|nr:MAG: endopeptidase La [Spirochaetes bacterium GWB1_36_13]HCL55830.1 endopeptidase La [Spirochaetia bacterium]
MEQPELKSNLISLDTSLPSILTIVPVFKNPIFPGIMVPIVVKTENNYPGLDHELRVNNFIGLLLVKGNDPDFTHEVRADDLYRIGTIAKILKRINLPDGNLNLLVNCLSRFEVSQFLEDQAPLKAVVSYVEEKVETSDLETKVLIKTITGQLEYLGKNNPLFMEQVKLSIHNAENAARIADFVASVLGDVEKSRQQEILEIFNVRKRLEKVAILLEEQINMMKVQERILNKINRKIEKQQREFFLREQMKAIKKELGMETDQKSRDIEKFQEKYKNLKIEETEVKEAIETELDKISALEPQMPEYNVAFTYLNTILSLPWNTFAEEVHNLERAKKILDSRHYGLKDVKERILEFLAVRKLNPQAKGSIICFSGPPGVGKTSLGKAIADTLNRPFFRFSVGGMRDEAEIKGHRRTYIGAMSGKIIQGLKVTKVKNPVFMIDEIDKIGVSYQGDPASALLEVLDPEQNINFRDHYLDLPFDLSNILFITTANTLDTIPAPLMDRMEIIRLSGYIAQEKYEIGKRFIIDKQQERHGLSKKDFIITKEAYFHIAEKYSREAGVRNFERQIERLSRKIAYKKALNQSYPKKITVNHLKDILGPEIFTDDEKKRIKKPGVAIGLAWTSMGGDTLFIESIAVKSKSGGLKLTGKLGEVMQESANIAYSYMRSLPWKKYDVNDDFFDNFMIHLHVPEGAVPKDGPSAGITMASSLFSLITGLKIKESLAMTGELTLTGSVLPVGGIKEKVIAAHRGKIKTILLPKENERDMKSIPDNIKKDIQFYFVSNMEEVIKLIFKKED